MYQLKILIKDFRPPIWRRVLIADEASFFDLHSLIQDIFDWEDYHLHAFCAVRNKGKQNIYIQNEETNDEWASSLDDELLAPSEKRVLYRDELATQLKEYLNEEFPHMTYEYDFGDSWDHQIVLEKVLSLDNSMVTIVVTGKRLGPPEDSRGWIHSAEEIVKSNRNKRSVAWKELCDAYGDEAARDIALMCKDFLLVAFDVSEIEVTDPKERLKLYES